MATLAGEASIKGGSEVTRMVLLTFASIGIAFTWGVETTYGTPYLLSLGLTKSNTSLIWIAGPLSGLLVQPVVGVISDQSTSRWGRRRPLMVAGAGVVAACLLVLGFARELVGLVLPRDEQAMAPTMLLAISTIYAVDFAINAVMSCARSLIVDTLPLEKQQTGAAWASRMFATGHLIGYTVGSVDLVAILGPALGDSQFRLLTVIASVAIVGSTAVTCWAVTERVLVSRQDGSRRSTLAVFRQIYSTLRHLPPRVQAICWAQFWSWIGWFPFLFYGTTWVGETYFRYHVPARETQSGVVLGDMGRIGSTSLLIYATVNFAGSLVLPLLVRSPEDDGVVAHGPPRALSGFAKMLEDRKPNLLTTWMCGHLVFATAMSLAPLATSFRFATALLCICGL